MPTSGGHWPLGIDRDQLNETFLAGCRDAGIAGTGRQHGRRIQGRSGARNGRCWTWHRPTRCWTRSGWRRRISSGFRVRTDNGDRLRIQIIAVQAFLPYPKLSEMVADQWAEDRHPGRCARTGAQPGDDPGCATTSIISTSGTMGEPSCCTCSRVTPYRWIRRRPIWGRNTRCTMPPAEPRGPSRTTPNILRIWELFSEAASLKADGRNKNAQEIWKLVIDQQYGIGTVGQSPAGLGVRLVNNRLGNIAARVCNAQHCRTPGNSHAETSGTSRVSRDAGLSDPAAGAGGDHGVGDHRGDIHHPCSCHPGDFVDAYVAQASAMGTAISAAEAAALRHAYGLDQSIWVQYFKWLNLIAHGQFGQSFEYGRPVTEVIGDRLWLTILLSVGAIIVTWGTGVADRDLLGGAAILDRRLHFHLYRLRRTGGAELSVGPDRDVCRAAAVQHERRGPVLLRVCVGAVVVGEGTGSGRPSAGADADPGTRRHRATGAYHAGQSAG